MSDILITLRKKLMFASSIGNALILIIITIIAFILSRQEIRSKSIVDLKNNLDEVKYRLQSEQSISDAWLAEMEVKNDIVISISDKGHIFLFPGSKETISDRTQLIKEARELVIRNKKVNLDDIGNSFYDEVDTIELYTEHKEHYICGIDRINILNENYEIIVLKDLKFVDQRIARLGILFILLGGAGVAALSLFCWWFAGIAIKPIEESREKQNQFIAAASHELKSPLTVLQTSATALKVKREQEQLELIEVIANECQRMKRLVNDLLILSNSDAANWTVQLRPVDMQTMLLNVYETLYDTVRSKQHSFELCLPEAELPMVICDEERIKQVIIILISNAVSYTDELTKIELALSQKEKLLQIKVIDHGKGLSDFEKKKVFQRFYRVDKARHAKEHYGLGLSIAYEIIKLHHGSLKIEDTLGGGCTFIIELGTSKRKKNCSNGEC